MTRRTVEVECHDCGAVEDWRIAGTVWPEACDECDSTYITVRTRCAACGVTGRGKPCPKTEDGFHV